MLNNIKVTGIDEFPVLSKQERNFQRPLQIIRFSDRKDASLNDSICFYEWDNAFEKKLNDKNITKTIPSLLNAGSVVQPDYSIYADDPIILQKYAVFKKNKVAAELQNAGLEVIPNLRWGDSRSFKFVFQGIPKHQVCAIGTYGQIKNKEKRYLFESGLEVALSTVHPREILVYGTMPRDIFGPYYKYIHFYEYPNWHEQYAKEAY